jgi:hypothetical protein
VGGCGLNLRGSGYSPVLNSLNTIESEEYTRSNRVRDCYCIQNGSVHGVT